MVGVPVLFVVWVVACPPFTCVMVVVVGVSWWRVFQYWVAVVFSSRRVPGVFWVWLGWLLVSWVCSGARVACSGVTGVVVGWLVPGVSGVCAWVAGVGESVWWFRMLTCLASFFFLVLSLVLFG